MSGVSEATLRAAMGAPLPLGKHPTLVADFNAALVAARCTTVRRAAMFCAQIGHESLGLRYFGELWGPTAQQKRYEPVTSLSKQLGNTAPGDGYRYRGRGPVQLTGKGGYVTFLAWCREQGYRPPDFLRDPDQVATSRWGFLAASHYWTVRRPGLNAEADQGDVRGATKLVNGGEYGLGDRENRYRACLRLGDRLLPAVSAAPTPASPTPKALPDMIHVQFDRFDGSRSGRLICPTGSASGVVGRAWLSATCTGGCRVEVWFQKGQPGGTGPMPGAGKPIDWTLRNGDRAWAELPNGTEVVEYRIHNAAGPGALCIEQAPK